MTIIGKIVGWIVSLCAALAGLVLVCAAAFEFYFLPAGLTCLAFAIAVNPLAIRKLSALHNPFAVTGIAIGAVISGIFSLTVAKAHIDASAAKESKVVEVTKGIEVKKSEAEI